MSDTWLRLSEPELNGNEERYLVECIRTNWISSLGPFVRKFETAFAAYLGGGTAVSTTSGTAALHTALLVAGVRPGDTVIVPTLTFIATVNPVRYVGAEPYFVDHERVSLNPDPREIMAAVHDLESRGKKPAAIVTVHLYGNPALMKDVVALAEAKGIPLIEDATEALGSKIDGEPVGTAGTLGCFSFNGNKLITSAGGGMIWSRDEQLAARARYLTTQARDDDFEYRHDAIGFNYRMTNIQAAVGLAQLERIESFIEKKRNIFRRYREALAAVPGLTLLGERAGEFNCCWMVALLVDRAAHPGGREGLMRYLNERCIEARPFFQPIHLQKPYQQWHRPLPVAEKLYDQGVNIPSNIGMCEADVARVSEAIRTWAQR